MAMNDLNIRLNTVEKSTEACLQIKRKHLENLMTPSANPSDLIVTELANTSLRKMSEAIATHIEYLSRLKTFADISDVRSFEGLDGITLGDSLAKAQANYNAALGLMEITSKQSATSTPNTSK